MAAEAHHAADSTTASGETSTLLISVCCGDFLLNDASVNGLISADDFGAPLQELPNGSVSLHQQGLGVCQGSLPHHGQWFCEFF